MSLCSSYSDVVATLSLQHTLCNTYTPLINFPLAVEFLFRRYSQHLWDSVSSHLAFRIVYNMDKRLHVDILRQIFNNISDEISENPPALLPLAQVSRGFHSVVTPLIYRIINIKRYNKNGQQYAKSLLTRLSTNTVVRSFIREIRVSDQAGTIPRDVQELLADLLPRLRRLNALYWLYQEHVDNWKLLDNLCQHWPEFRLDLRKVTLLRAHADPMVLAKAHLMLRSLAVQIGAFDLEENPKIKLFQLLETCPHLQILDIRWDFGDPDHEIPISMDIGLCLDSVNYQSPMISSRLRSFDGGAILAIGRGSGR